MDLLERLSEASGTPGQEKEIRSIITEALTDHVDTFKTDRLGNTIAHRKGETPGVVAAHMDEIGFIVSLIEKDTGFLRFQPRGGFDTRSLISQRVVVHTESEDLIGCIGSKPVHIPTEEERKNPLELKDLFIDLGLPEEQVQKLVTIGDMVTLKQEFLTHGNVVSGKALDDRSGVYIGIEAIKRAKTVACDLYFIGTTQEEVGLRGARVAGFAPDATVAADMPGVPDAQQGTQLGSGVGIKLNDSASISHPRLVQEMRTLAGDRKIPYQMEILPRNGTDAGTLQLAQEGAAVITLSLPTRYAHSVVEMAHRDDLEATISLLAAFLETADQIDLAL